MRCENCEESAYVIDKLAKLLAEIAIIVNGTEPHDTLWSYHDLPEKVRALKQAPPAAVSLPAPLPPAPDTMNLTEAQREIEDAFRRGWNSCRATVMQATPAAAVPDALLEIGRRLAADRKRNDHHAADPIYTVQREVCIYGLDAVHPDDIETVRSISDCSDTVITEADSASLVRVADFLEALRDCRADRDELFAVNTRQREALNAVASILEVAVRYLRSEASFDELYQGARDVAPFRNAMAAHGLGPVGEEKPARRRKKP